jgi:hypothetical protein
MRASLLVLSAWTLACGPEPLDDPPEFQLGVIHYNLAKPYEACESSIHSPLIFSLHVMEAGSDRCSLETGSLGEPNWVSPSAIKYPIDAQACEKAFIEVSLSFCRVRVSRTAFRPLTVDPAEKSQFYAVLRMGDSCPKNSISISKFIYSAVGGEKNRNKVTGKDISPHEVQQEHGNYTWLHFCYFTTAPSLAETMSEFPELRVPYAVFHDFDIAAPSWVMEKRWVLTDDNEVKKDVYYPGLTPKTAAFADIIENPLDGPQVTNTVLDMARVR